jgi:hypothetical protein
MEENVRQEINKLELERIDLLNQFKEIIYQPISDSSIAKAETEGVDLLSNLINNKILIDVLNLS